MEKTPRVQSVALLLFNDEGELYLVRELGSKPEIGKIVGSKDRSFPWETLKEGEPYPTALSRLVIEEIDQTGMLHMSRPDYVGNVWVYDTLAHIFTAHFLSGPMEMRGTDAGIEIEPLGWHSREFLLERPRDGVREVLVCYDQWVQKQMLVSASAK